MSTPDTHADGRKLTPVTLRNPLKRGDQEISVVNVVQPPKGGELRGLDIVALGQLNYDQVERLIPRITFPSVSSAEFAAMEGDDIARLSVAACDFLQG